MDLQDLLRGGMLGLSTDVVGGPVDLVTTLLRPFGYKTDKPVMGSDWIADKIGAKPTGSGAETVGRLATGLLSPDPMDMARISGLLGAGIIKPQVANALNFKTSLPAAPEFAAAVANTPGAK